MATFHVGQRVKIISPASLICGREATIIGDLRERNFRKLLTGERGRALSYELEVDNTPIPAGFSKPWVAEPHHLAPLTPPAEDAWASEAVRKVTKPLHTEPVVVKEKA